MSEYCSATDIQERLTTAGVNYVADRDGDGSLTTAEQRYITSAIEWAGNLIDEAMLTWVAPATARAASNNFLRDRAVDLAAYRAAGSGGREVPQSLVDAYLASMEALERVRKTGRVPGFVFAAATHVGTSTLRHPRVVNPR